jgi:hypothetical protein
LTTYIAISGGKDRLAAASRAIVQAGHAALEESLNPLAHMLLGQTHEAGNDDKWGPFGNFDNGPTSSGQAQGRRRAAKGLQKLIAFL